MRQFAKLAVHAAYSTAQTVVKEAYEHDWHVGGAGVVVTATVVVVAVVPAVVVVVALDVPVVPDVLDVPDDVVAAPVVVVVVAGTVVVVVVVAVVVAVVVVVGAVGGGATVFSTSGSSIVDRANTKGTSTKANTIAANRNHAFRSPARRGSGNTYAG